jgi:hypothetical protein
MGWAFVDPDSRGQTVDHWSALGPLHEEWAIISAQLI